jgi:carbamoyltransferase
MPGRLPCHTREGVNVSGNNDDPEYYLSCYLVPPGEHSVLVPRHDQNVALWRVHAKSVELVRFWEVERHSGQKHHHWPLYTEERARSFLDHLLAQEGLSLSDVGVVWGTPGIGSDADLKAPPGAEIFPLHSLAHLFSGLLMDTEIFAGETIVAMAVDNGPDFALDAHAKNFWYAGCVSRRGELMFAPVESPAPLYAAATEIFDREPGTLMALASACPTKITFDEHDALESMRLPGGRVPPQTVAVPFVQSILDEARKQLADRVLHPAFTAEEHLCGAVMAVVQRCCELIAIRNVQRLCRLAGVRPEDSYLSLSGGFALNCPANSRLVNHFNFKGLLVPPCANDSGQALGIGLLGLFGRDTFEARSFRLESAYHGSAALRLADALREYGPWIKGVTEFSAGQFVADVIDGPLAWLDGAGEIGPRALGHRSLLGDPRTLETKDLLNRYKQRQWWRPVAPIVLEELAHDWFDQGRPSPYMLETADVRAEMRERVPAVVHLDGSARHQTLRRAVNPRLYDAIDAFRQATGVPILCNTSLNDKGEPIVDSAAQGLNFCIRKGIAIAYVDGHRIELSAPADDLDVPTRPHVRDRHFFAGQQVDRDRIWHRWLDRGFSSTALFLLTRSPDLRIGYRDGLVTANQVNDLAEYGAGNDEFASVASRYAEMYGPRADFFEYHQPLED